MSQFDIEELVLWTDAWREFREGKYTDAYAKCKQLLPVLSEDREFLELAVRCSYKANLYTESLSLANKMLLLYPDYAVSHLSVGINYEFLRTPSEALDFINKAIELDSNCVDAYEHRAGVLERVGKYDDALQDYAHAIALCKTKDSYAKYIPYYKLCQARCYASMGKTDEVWHLFLEIQTQMGDISKGLLQFCKLCATGPRKHPDYIVTAVTKYMESGYKIGLEDRQSIMSLLSSALFPEADE